MTMWQRGITLVFWSLLLLTILAACIAPAHAQALSEKDDLCKMGAYIAVIVADEGLPPYKTADEALAAKQQALAELTGPEKFVLTRAIKHGFANRGQPFEAVANSFYNQCMKWSFA